MAKLSPAPDPDLHYHPAQKALHWLTVIVMIAAFALVWSVDNFDDHDLRQLILGLHRLSGFILAGLTLVRLGLRLRLGSPPADPATPALQHLVASIVHGGLYLLLIVQPLVGWVYSSAKGRGIDLAVASLPALTGRDPVLADLMGEVHETIGTLFLVLIGLHVVGALYHALWRRDRTLTRMLPAFGTAR